MIDSGSGEGTPSGPIALKVLLQQRHLQTHRAFCREYDKIADKLDRSLRGSWPRKAQFYRWLSGELIGLPYPDHCRILEAMFPGWKAAQLFETYDPSVECGAEDEHQEEAAAVATGTAEIVNAYPYRSHFTNAAWWDLISGATKQIDLLGYTLYFLSLDHPQLIETLREKCANGCVVRATIADPDSEHVAYRDQEEDQPITIVARIKSTIKHFAPLVGVEGFELRYHNTPLYNSIFRFDDDMLVTPHLYATPGSAAPLLHLRNLGTNGLFTRFAGHFEGMWSSARPADPTTKKEITNGAN
jgi:hypothetical protein